MEGNQQKMREALVELTDKVLDYLHKGLILLPLPLDNATAKARAALSAPARQCDVGAADEQDARFSRFCVEKRSGSCSGCPDAVGGFTVANGIRECALVWAQTPYAEEGCAE